MWWTHLNGGCCCMDTKIVCNEKLLGEVKWAAAYAASLLRGCRE